MPAYKTIWRQAVTRDSRLTPGARLAATVLADYENHEYHGVAWVALVVLAERLGSTPKTCQRYLADLRQAGWIVQLSAPTKGKPPRYRLLIPDLDLDSRSAISSRKGRHPVPIGPPPGGPTSNDFQRLPTRADPEPLGDLLAALPMLNGHAPEAHTHPQ